MRTDPRSSSRHYVRHCPVGHRANGQSVTGLSQITLDALYMKFSPMFALYIINIFSFIIHVVVMTTDFVSMEHKPTLCDHHTGMSYYTWHQYEVS